MDAIFPVTSIKSVIKIIHNLLVIKAKKHPLHAIIQAPDQLAASMLSSRNTLIISTLFSYMEVEHRASMYPSVCACVCVCVCACVFVHQAASDLPFSLLTLFNRSPSLLPSSSLSRRISLLLAATWCSLTGREGIKDSLISTQIKRHFGFLPTRRLAGARDPEASVCFL